jgi:transposase
VDVTQIRAEHTQILESTVALPNTTARFTADCLRLERHQRRTGIPEIVVAALEPTGTYHHALAAFLDGRGTDGMLMDTHVVAPSRTIPRVALARASPPAR